MSLEDLNQSVYQPDFQGGASGTHPGQPATLGTQSEKKAVNPKLWTDHVFTPEERLKLDALRERKKRLFAIVLGILALVGIVVFGFMARRFFLFDAEKVMLELTGPEGVTTGELVPFTVHYTNENWVGLAPSELTLYYPQSFHLRPAEGWDITETRATYHFDTLSAHAEDTIHLQGTFSALDKRLVLMRAVWKYSPKGISSSTERESTWSVQLDSSALKVVVDGPPTLFRSQTPQYTIRYTNESSETLENLRLVTEYPDGFIPTTFDPRPTVDTTTWYIPVLKPGESQQVMVKGEIQGEAGDALRLLAKVGKQSGDGTFVSLAQEEKVTRVVSPPLALQLLSNDRESAVVQPGESISLRLVFENTGSTGIRDIIASAKLETAYLDMAHVVLPQGATYSKNDGTIFFRASENPALRSLEPRERGEIAFSVRVRSDIGSLGKRNVEIHTRAMLDSPDLTRDPANFGYAAVAETVVRITSPTQALCQGFYHDSIYTNSGPLPPRVAEETTYTLRCSARAGINSLREGKLVLNFPGSARVRETLGGRADEVQYNERTGELVWTVGSIDGGSTAGKELVLKLGFTPTPGSAGQSPNLLNGGEFTAKETFVEQPITIAIPSKTIELPEDSRLDYAAKRVANVLPE